MKFAIAPLSIALLAAPLVQAKLPALTPEAQAKADEAKLKTAWTDKVTAYQLCRSMDRVAAHYVKTAKAAAKETHQPATTAPCTDPGPFVAPAPAPPLEAAGARSPAATAAAPPSTKATQAEIAGTKK